MIFSDREMVFEGKLCGRAPVLKEWTLPVWSLAFAREL